MEEKLDGRFRCSDAGVLRRVAENGVIALIYEACVYSGFSDPDLGILEAADPLFFPKLRKLLEM